jgi:uncharacterized membrane protein
MAVKTWVWIVVGLVALALVAFVALVAAGVYFVARDVETTAASPAAAEAMLDEARARFSGPPLVEIDERGQTVTARVDPQRPRAAVTPTVLVVLAWDADEERLVRIRLPLWLLRLGSRGSGSIQLGGGRGRIQLERLQLSVADLERLGPALLIDHRTPAGDRVVVWTEE